MVHIGKPATGLSFSFIICCEQEGLICFRSETTDQYQGLVGQWAKRRVTRWSKPSHVYIQTWSDDLQPEPLQRAARKYLSLHLCLPPPGNHTYRIATVTLDSCTWWDVIIFAWIHRTTLPHHFCSCRSPWSRSRTWNDSSCSPFIYLTVLRINPSEPRTYTI